MKITKLKTKTPMVSITADDGCYLAPVGTPLHEVTEAKAASVLEAEINRWTEYRQQDVEAAKAEADRIRKYEKRVVELIREKYSADDETAILRKYIALQSTPQQFDDQKMDEIVKEFDHYNAFAEACKAEAKQQISQQIQNTSQQ